MKFHVISHVDKVFADANTPDEQLGYSTVLTLASALEQWADDDRGLLLEVDTDSNTITVLPRNAKVLYRMLIPGEILLSTKNKTSAQFKFRVKKLCYVTSRGEDINLQEGGELSVTQLAPSSHTDDCWLLEYVFESKVRHVIVSNNDFDWLRRKRFIEEQK